MARGGDNQHTDIAQHLLVYKTSDVQNALAHSRGEICIVGGGYSMGGQTRQNQAMQLDMRGMNKVLWVNPNDLTMRVQGGASWR